MKRVLLVFALAFCLLLGFSRSTHAWAPFESVCTEGSTSSLCSNVRGRNDTPTNNPITGSGGILTKAINLLAFLTGVASIIIIIIGGIKYTTSAGEPNKVSSAKDTILYAVIGLIVSVTARGIILFIVDRVK